MFDEHKDEKAVLEDFEESMQKELEALPANQRQALLEVAKKQFDKGFEHVKQHRHKLKDRSDVLSDIHKAKIHLHNARHRELGLQYAEEFGYGMGLLIGVIEYGCFRNHWKEEARIIGEHLVDTIRLLDRASHDRHHKHIWKRVKRIVAHYDTTPEEQELGARIIDAFK